MSKLAKMITHFLIGKRVIDESEREVYYYCYEMLLSTIVNCCIMVVLMVFTRLYIETIFFSLTFIFLRRFSGGYHSKTHIGCLLSLIISYVVMWGMITFISSDILIVLSLIFIIFSIITIFILAPLENRNNPLKDKKKLKLKSKILILSLAIIVVLFSNIQLLNEYGFLISYASALVSLSLIIGKVQSKQLARKAI